MKRLLQRFRPAPPDKPCVLVYEHEGRELRIYAERLTDRYIIGPCVVINQRPALGRDWRRGWMDADRPMPTKPR